MTTFAAYPKTPRSGAADEFNPVDFPLPRLLAGSPQVNARARKYSQAVRNRLQEVGQASVAAACNVDVATVSRWVSEGKFDHFCVALETIGLKVVPGDFKCVKAAELDHVMFWARKGLEAVRSADDLCWPED